MKDYVFLQSFTSYFRTKYFTVKVTLLDLHIYLVKGTSFFFLNRVPLLSSVINVKDKRC